MNLKALAVAAAFAILAIASLAMYTKRLEVEASGGERVAILMISKPGKRNGTLTEANLAVREVPIAYVDDRTVRASDKAKVVGVRIEHDVEPGQVLQWGDVAVSGMEDRHLSQLVQAGSRALTLQVPESYMSIQMLRPGDYVDILGVVNEGSRQSAVVLLQKVLVLAIGEDTMPTHESGQNVSARLSQLLTVSVTLQESQTIALAAQKGPVYAVLRSPEDPSVSDKIPTVTQILAPPPAARVAPRANDPRPKMLNGKDN